MELQLEENLLNKAKKPLLKNAGNVINNAIMKNKIRLGVNIDHVATIRNARGGCHPDPVDAAIIAQNSGADGITIHL